MNKNLIFAISLHVTTFTFALENPERYSEGSCARSPPHPIVGRREIIDSFKYLIGGAQYGLHLIAFNHPNFPHLTDSELKMKACFSRNTTTTARLIPPAVISGFGLPLFPYQPVVKPGIYLEAVPRTPGEEYDTGTDVVTLTDHKTFAVLRNCLNGRDRRTWFLVSKTPEISNFAMEQVKTHVASMGFKNNFFLDFNECPNRDDVYVTEW